MKGKAWGGHACEFKKVEVSKKVVSVFFTVGFCEKLAF